MAKSFTDQERELIRAGLVSACQTCWARYGYHKTGVRELASMVDISPGAFYQFFSSKEALFVAAAEAFQADLVALFHTHMTRQPNKQGVAASLKAVVAELGRASWLSAVWEEWPSIARKLPPGYVEDDFVKDTLQIEAIVRQYKLVPHLTTEQTTLVIDILLASVSRTAFMPGQTSQAFDFMIDAVVEKLFG